MSRSLCRHDLVHPDGRSFHVYGELRGRLNGQPVDNTERTALHQRFDRLTQQWVAVSPSRNARPGGTAAAISCPLCVGGVEMPFEFDAVVFDNRFPALSITPPEPPVAPFFAASAGRCQVVVYTSDHDESLATLAPGRIADVVAIWRDRTEALWAEGHHYVMAFENRGDGVGATLNHPHGQIYAFDHLPPTTVTKIAALEAGRAADGRCLSCAVVADELAGARQILANDSFVVHVPFAARWPYEVHVRARRHGCRRLADLTDAEALDLARSLREVTGRYNALFGFELPYMMCVQEAPAGADDWHLHVEFLPPNRSP
jgi:UDPglucose--hexose-1-phosphate uridylyltransferase